MNMIAKDFEQVNVKIAEHQEEFETLPARVEENQIITCFELSEEELNQVRDTKCIWLKFAKTGAGFQPIHMDCLNPYPETT